MKFSKTQLADKFFSSNGGSVGYNQRPKFRRFDVFEAFTLL
jgi:hypothetical protein